MYGNRDADFMCPVFRRVDRKTSAIVCEGVLPEATEEETEAIRKALEEDQE